MYSKYLPPVPLNLTFQEHPNYPCVAQSLEHPLGVREAGVRSPTASHQRRKKWEVCAVRQPTGRLGVSINGMSDSFLLTCVELNRWLGTQKLSGVDRSTQTRQVHINSHAYSCIHHRIQLAIGDMTMSG